MAVDRRARAGVEALNAWSDEHGAVQYLVREGDSVVRRVSTGHLASYVRMSDVTRDLMREIRASRFIGGVSREGSWLRLGWKSYRAREVACAPDGWFASREIASYEGDVSATMRWRVDFGVRPQRPRRCYLDIETCARVPFSRKEEMRILSWVLSDEAGREIVGVLDADTDEAEKSLLADLWAALDDYDQVVAWNGDGFDFPVIFARSKARGISLDARRWLWLDHMVVFRRMNTAAESGDEKQSMALQSVATAVLGEGKIPGFTAETIFPSWAAGGESRRRLVEYNAHDVRLMVRIEERTGYLDLLQTLCETSGVFADTRGVRPMPQVETFVMRLARGRDHRFPTRHRVEDVAAFRGALVLEPRASGLIRERVHVCDFSAMYPSIVQSWNLSPETLRERPPRPFYPSYLKHLDRAWKPPPRPDDCAEAPGNGVWFAQEPRGLLPEVLDSFLALRREWSERKATLPPNTPEWVAADRKSTAYKVMANSVFGVASSPLSRLHTRAVGEGITRTGAWLLQKTLDAAGSRFGSRAVIYGDTDSGFARGCSDEEMRAFVAWCNAEFYPGLLAETGARRCTISLAYEKAFDRMVFVSAKRYVGRLAHYKGSLPDARTKPEVKGLEYKRGDVSRLAREMQAEVIDLLMGGGVLGPRRDECEDDPAVFAALIERWQARVLSDPLEVEDVQVVKRLSRPLREYAVRTRKDGSDGASPPHVRVARMLRERGRDVGEGGRVAYFVSDATQSPPVVLPAEDWQGECDRYALWESQVWQPTERLLCAAFPDADWTRYGRVRSRRTRRAATPAAKAPKRKPSGDDDGQIGLFSLDSEG